MGMGNGRTSRLSNSLKTLSQAQASLEKLTNAKTVAVIGAGQIGLESLDALSQLDLNLHVFEAQDSSLQSTLMRI